MNRSDEKKSEIRFTREFIKASSALSGDEQSKASDAFDAYRNNQNGSGLALEPIEGKPYYYAARIAQDLRAILYVRNGKSIFLWIGKEEKANAWIENHFLDVDSGEIVAVAEAVSSASTDDGASSIFADYSREQLAALGVSKSRLASVLSIRSIEELQESRESFSSATFDALYFLAERETYEDVLSYYLEAVGEDANEKTENKFADAFEVALRKREKDGSLLIVDDERELRDALCGDIEAWRYFLHPTQRKLAYKSFNGPARVLGAAGTGKTVVAIHRAKYLAENVFTKTNDRILVTTFTKNLAADIRAQLQKICSRDAFKRIDVVNISSWTAGFLRRRGYQYNADPQRVDACWQKAFDLQEELNFSQQFYKDEYALIIQPQNIRSLAEYKRASRVGRGRPLNHKEKTAAWPVFSEFFAQTINDGVKSYDELYLEAATILSEPAPEKRDYPYRSVVVDETQDFSLCAYRLLRAMVPEGPNDVFMVGDARQRIYGYKSSLSAAGINIRGRGHKLRVNYRTTKETFEFAERVMTGVDYDDLDQGNDPQNACVSLTSGKEPIVQLCETIEEEQAFALEVLNNIREKEKAENKSGDCKNACVVARTAKILNEWKAFFKKQEIAFVELDQNDPQETANKPGVRLATIHRVKGLEFDYVLLLDVNQGVIPNQATLNAVDKDDLIATELAEKKERSLLYVALTRARKAVFIGAKGKISPFLKNE